MGNPSFTDYERITDTLMYLTDKITLSFTLALSKKMLNGQKSFFHYETLYNNSYGNEARSVKRNMNYYFVISNKEIFGSGIVLRPQDVELLIMLINERILPWFFSQDKHAFQIIDDKLVLKEYTPAVYTQSENKFISFEPIVYHYEESGQFAEGINLGLGSGESCPMTIDKFMGFFNIIKTDMYATACALANYVKTAPYNINTYSASGLGANPNKPKDEWNNQKSYSGFGANSFLDNSKIKKGN